MEIDFVKLQGNGNDFILIDEYGRTVIPDEMKPEFAATYCDRRFGIGADGVIYLSKSKDSEIRIRIFHPDRSEAGISGSDILCTAKYAFDAGYVREACSVETLAGEMRVIMGYRDDEFMATVAMTEPKFDRKDIPATGEGEYKEHIGNFDVYATNTGVPHAVVPVPSVDAIDIDAVAPAIRRHPTFPDGTNVNFVEKTGDSRIRIRTFERGVESETLSCGTGATASAAVMHRLGLVGDNVNVETGGGPLVIFLKAGARMEGPAETVFSGTILF